MKESNIGVPHFALTETIYFFAFCFSVGHVAWCVDLVVLQDSFVHQFLDFAAIFVLQATL